MKIWIILAFLLCASVLYAVPIPTSFTNNYLISSNPGYINTDIEASPTISGPPGSFCTNAVINLNLSIPQKQWLVISEAYGAFIRNNCPSVDCLTAYGSTAPGNFNWVTTSQLNSLNTRSPPYFSSPSDFNSFVSGMQNSVYTQKTKYRTGSGGAFTQGNGNQYFKSDMGVFCRGDIRLISSAGLNQLIASDYLGTPLNSQPVTLPATPGTVTFNLKTILQSCLASARAYNNLGSGICTNADYVYIYKSTQFPFNFNSNTLSIAVENHFLCSLVTATRNTPIPITATQGIPFNVQFTINNANSVTRALLVNTNSMTVSNGFTKQSVSPSGTVSISSPGSRQFTMSVVAGTVANGQTLTVTIPSYTDGAACDGTHNCQNTVQFTVNVNPPTSYSCTLAMVPDNIIYGPGSRTVRATCRTNGVATTCTDDINWQTTFGLIARIAPAPYNSSTLTVPQVAASTPGTVTASYTKSGNAVSCPANFTVLPPTPVLQPDYVPQITPVSGYVNQPFTATFRTINSGNRLCENQTQTNVAFAHSQYDLFSIRPLNANGDSVTNTRVFTCPGTPGLYDLEEYVDATYKCGESNENNNYQLIKVNCSTAPPPLKPNYIVRVTAPQTVYVNHSFGVQSITSNIGTAPGGGLSVTRIRFPPSQVASALVQDLGIGATYPYATNFTCPLTPGTYYVNATADATGTINESNEGDNSHAVIVNCIQMPVNPAVSCTLAPNPGGTYMLGGTGIFTATCRDINNAIVPCLALSWTSTRGSMQPTTTSNGTLTPQSTFNATSLGTGEVTADARSFSCSSPVNVTSGFGNLSISCEFVDHGPDFYPGESAQVRADCINGGNPPCPALTWTTTITPANLTPSYTAAGSTPQFSLFSISPQAQPPQTGVVHIQCDEPGCNAFCDVSVNLYSIPNRLVCTLENRTINPPTLFSINDWSWVRGRCYSNTQETICPELEWFTRNDPIPNTYFVPNPTLQQLGPLTNFSTQNVPPPFPRNGYIDARSQGPIPIVSLVCEAAINVSVVPAIGPDYEIVRLRPSKLVALINEQITIDVWTGNTGNVAATSDSTTLSVVLPPDCVQDMHNVPPLIAGATNVHSFVCTCLTLNRHNINATADAFNNIIETNEKNNNKSAFYYCGIPFAPVCEDYV